MTFEKIAVYGASGFGREVMPLVRQQYPDSTLCFVDDGCNDTKLNGYPVYSFEEYIQHSRGCSGIVVAIADAKIRESLELKCIDKGMEIVPVRASNTIILDEVELKDGAILCPFTTLTSNIKIGRSFQANIYSYVGHDCQIGDYVTFAPSVKCNGNVQINDRAYIGTGAIIKQGRPGRPLVIGEGATVGMGAVVTKNVPAGAVVIGNPAKPLARRGLGG
ncbi:acetyltransferase [Corallincola luteus]|uniref:Acetyltransferase n=1 Tax=Corallincola luteus TaxID=1775177 RepID=A0ABY2ARV3_9GAMM|nr:acetyltransferase [Corallincola luteus]TCI05423.1 acetyltransferase [Corallincola luteus]